MNFVVLVAVGLLGSAAVVQSSSPPYCYNDDDPKAAMSCAFLNYKFSPFSQCTAKIGKHDVDKMLKDCKVQFCLHGKKRVCELAAMLANNCKVVHHIPVMTWRSDDFCSEHESPNKPPSKDHCSGNPNDDPEAKEACDWIIADNSPFLGCLYHLGLDGMDSAFKKCTYKFCKYGMKAVCDYAEYMEEFCMSEYMYEVSDWRDWKTGRFCESKDPMKNPCEDPSKNAEALEACSFFQDKDSPYYNCMSDIHDDQAKNFMKQCTKLYCYSNTGMLCKLLDHVQGYCYKHGHYIQGLPDFCKPAPVTPSPSGYCVDEPSMDENAMKACSFLLDITSPLYECLKHFHIEKIKRFYKVCLQIYCDMGTSGVCCYAEHIPEICECQYGLTVPLGLDYCDGKTTAPPTTTPSTGCDGDPAHDEAAIEACQFLLDYNHPFYACGQMLGLHKVKKFFLMCVNMYCKSGIKGVCMFYENIQGICEEKGVDVDEDLDVCLKPTPKPTTTEKPLCVDNPEREEDAIEACSFILDLSGEFAECLKKLGLPKRKMLYKRCLYFYCVEGQDGVCHLAEHLADICYIKHGISIDLEEAGLGYCLPGTTQAPTTSEPLCVDDPSQDENAREACSFLLNTDSPFHDCMSTLDLMIVKKLYKMCLHIYCTQGMPGVCEYARKKAKFCEMRTGSPIPDLDVCLPPTSGPTEPPPTTGPLCVGTPSQDDNAIEACDFILAKYGPFSECLGYFDLDRIKKFFVMCTAIYCDKGIAGVCEFADNLADICEEKFNITITEELDICLPPTSEPTPSPGGFCVDDPQKDGEAMAACSFLLDMDSPFRDCLEKFNPYKIKKLYYYCVQIYCKDGMDGVCCFADYLPIICEVQFNVIITVTLEQCGGTTTAAISTTTTPYCVEEPHHDEMAREYCQIILESHFKECTAHMDLDQVKDYYNKCLIEYCLEGEAGACGVFIDLVSHCSSTYQVQIDADMCVDALIRQTCTCTNCTPMTFECVPVTGECDCPNCDCNI